MVDKALVKTIKDCLTPDLLENKFWRERQKKRRMAGFCYIASEAYYHLRGKYDQYKPHHIKVTEGKHDFGHWFLKSDDGKIIDITAEQFNRIPDYAKSKCRAWLTKHPSRRAKVIINRVRGKCKHSWTKEQECCINFCHHCCQTETEILKNEIVRLKSELELFHSRPLAVGENNAQRQSLPRTGTSRKNKGRQAL